MLGHYQYPGERQRFKRKNPGEREKVHHSRRKPMCGEQQTCTKPERTTALCDLGTKYKNQ